MSFQYVKDEPEIAEEFGPAVVPKFPLYTAILIACIAAVFASQLIFGDGLGSLLLGDSHSARAAGFDKLRFYKYHEYWRILTGATVHGGLIHAGMNCYAFYSFGRVMEMLANRAHVAIVFLLAAIGGGILSLIFLPGATSVGASGGIVGLIGYLAVYAFRRRDFISKEFRRGLIFNIGFIFLYGLALYQVIDNFGHLGGLITGAIYGFISIPSDPYVDPRDASAATRVFGLGALLIFIATSVLSILLIANFS